MYLEICILFRNIAEIFINIIYFIKLVDYYVIWFLQIIRVPTGSQLYPSKAGCISRSITSPSTPFSWAPRPSS